MKNIKKWGSLLITTGLILVILGLILLGVSVYFIFNEGKHSNEILLTYGVGTVIYCFGFYLRIKI